MSIHLELWGKGIIYKRGMTGKVSILVCPLAPHTTNIKVLSFALYGGGEEGNIIP